MNMKDKIAGAAEDLKGKAKEAAAELTGNEKWYVEGKADQASAAAKKAGERAQDRAPNGTRRGSGG